MAIYKLGDISDIVKGSPKYTKNYCLNNKGKHPVYSSKITGKICFGKINSFDFEKNKTLITSVGCAAGTILFSKDNFSITTNCFAILNNKNVFVDQFLFYFLKSKENEIKKEAFGSARAALSKANLSKFQVNLPSLETQQQIIDIIEPLEKINQLMERKTKLFLRKILFFNQAMFKKLEKEKIYILGDICNIKRGRIISSIEILNNSGPYPVISSNTMNNGILGHIKTYDYDGEYITISADGVYAGTVYYQNKKFSPTNVCFVLIKKDEYKYLIKYLYFLLKSNETKNREKYSTGSTRKSVRAYGLKIINVNLPSLETQRQIINIIEPLYEQLNLLRKKLVLSRNKLNYFLNKLIEINKEN